jgi:pimeloyl-ACP methyl ester carboxylesterase
VRRKTLSAILAAGIALLCLAAWPYASAHLQAVAVLREVAGQPVPWIARDLTVPVTTEDLSFPIETASGQEQVRARVYTPKDRLPKNWTPRNRSHAPAMVIFHGVHHLGIDEPRLVGFAAAMAACGIRVLTPELPGIKDYHVSEDSVAAIGESVRWFAAQTGGPVGVMGLSFSGGLALVAASEPQYHPAFKFVVAVGSQDSMLRVAEYYLTGRDARPDGSVETLPPHEYGPLVLEYKNLDEFVPAADLEPVRAVLRAHLYEDRAGEAVATRLLNDAQRREARDLMDTSLPATRSAIAASIARHAGDSPGLSPQERLRTLGTPVYLLHGEGDNIIPSAETLWMASELQPDDLKAMLVSPVLSHLDLNGPKPGPMDQWRLVHFFALMIHAAQTR